MKAELEITDNRFEVPDLAYRRLTEAHRGLSAEDCAALDARLVLILANQVGDLDVLEAAIRLARESMPSRALKDSAP